MKGADARLRLRVLVAGLGLLVGPLARAITGSPRSATLPVSGTVGGAPEGVAFSGTVQIRSHLVTDPDFGKPPTVHLAIDLVDLIGRGLTSGAKYVTTAEFVSSAEVNANEVIELTFPFQPQSKKGHLVARSGNIALTLRFDARNGAVIGGSGRVSSID